MSDFVSEAINPTNPAQFSIILQPGYQYLTISPCLIIPRLISLKPRGILLYCLIFIIIFYFVSRFSNRGDCGSRKLCDGLRDV
jgi:hypothetical protein